MPTIEPWPWWSILVGGGDAPWTCDCCGTRYGPKQLKCEYCNPPAQYLAKNIPHIQRIHICAPKPKDDGK